MVTVTLSGYGFTGTLEVKRDWGNGAKHTFKEAVLTALALPMNSDVLQSIRKLPAVELSGPGDVKNTLSGYDIEEVAGW